MSKQDKFVKRRLYASTISTIVSIGLVLFMLGLVGIIILTSEKISVIVKENIGFSVYLENHAKEVEVLQLQKYLDAADFIKSSSYISKEDAAKILREELDPQEDFIQFLDGHNPLPASIDAVLHAAFAHPDSIQWIVAELNENKIVKEVVYSKSLVNLVNENVKKISLFIIGFGSLLFIIAIALINNTIRLTIYSKRFLIRTMQLVGATKGFIQRPFIITGISHGIFASMLAVALLTGFLYLAQQQIPELIEMQDLELLFSLLIGIVLSGVVISYFSTYLAVRKYLRLKTDELYY